MAATRVLLAVALLAIVPALVAASSCSDATALGVNPAFHRTAAGKWADLVDETEFRRFRVAHVASSVEAYPTGSFSGRGVVMTVATSQEVSSAYVAIAKLRATGNTMPVELFYADAIADAAISEFQAMAGVTVRSVSLNEETALVPTALKQSSFEDVLLLSARTHAIVDPASVFETAEYARTGLLLWPSLHKTAPSNPIWSIMSTPCVDAFEQTAAAAVVNKAKAWAALNVAAHFRGSFYQSMINGDDSILALGAKATNTEVHMAPSSQAVGTQYVVSGARQFCAHSMVLAAPVTGSPMFLHTAGAEVAVTGAQGKSLTCLENAGVAVQHDDELVSQLVRLQASVPSNAQKIALQACTRATPMTEAEYDVLVGPSGKFYKYATGAPTSRGEAYARTIDGPALSEYVTTCGSFFSYCGSGSGSFSNDVRVFLFNLTSLTQSANVRITTPTQAGHPIGNYTLLRVMDNGQRRDECSYGGLSGPSSVTHNIVSGGYAVVAVAWKSDVSTPYSIPVKVYYNGPSSAATAQASASLPVIALAVVASIAARFL